MGNFRSVPGKGVVGTVEGRQVAHGNAALLRDLVVAHDDLQPQAAYLPGAARTVVLVTSDGRFAGMVSVADPARPSTPEAVRLLHADELRLIMLTGDRQATAEASQARTVSTDRQ